MKRVKPLNKPFLKAAIARSGPLFEWLGKDSARLDELLRGKAPEALQDLWKQLVMAHALDLFHDEGMQGLAWPTAASQAIATLCLLLKVSPEHAEKTMELEGFQIVFCPTVSSPPSDVSTLVSDRDPLEKLRVMTMADVQRNLSAWSSDRVLEVSRTLRREGVVALPSLGLASGSFMALAALGSLTRTPALMEERGVRSLLVWKDWDLGEGPTGEHIAHRPRS